MSFSRDGTARLQPENLQQRRWKDFAISDVLQNQVENVSRPGSPLPHEDRWLALNDRSVLV
jgi:hypothetical protein